MSLTPLYSTFAGEDLCRLVAAEYDLPGPITCRLMRRSFNDHYLVTAGTDRYIFRLYHGLPLKYWLRGEGDVRFELELLAHLHQEGVPVSRALPRRSGDLLGAMSAPEGDRHYALFTFAAGAPARQATAAQSFTFGETLARLHLGADRFQPAQERYSIDLTTLLDKQLPLLEPHLAPEDLTFVQEVAESVRRELAGLGRAPGLWGVIHGDPHSGNCHFTPDGAVTFFDFDIAGYGWRAYDLVVALPDEEEPRSAMLAGYESLRPLSEAEKQALPWLLRARVIWDVGDNLHMNCLFGEARTPELVKWMLKTLRETEGR